MFTDCVCWQHLKQVGISSSLTYFYDLGGHFVYHPFVYKITHFLFHLRSPNFHWLAYHPCVIWEARLTLSEFYPQDSPLNAQIFYPICLNLPIPAAHILLVSEVIPTPMSSMPMIVCYDKTLHKFRIQRPWLNMHPWWPFLIASLHSFHFSELDLLLWP